MKGTENREDALIRLEDICVSYDRLDVLHHVDLTVCNGDFMAITGPNGGGKTTLLRVILKLLKPTSGRVEYFHDGERVKNLHFGYLPQKSLVDTKFPISVKETVASGLLHGFRGRLHSQEERRNIDEAIALCGIEQILDRHIGALSGGQLQRTLLARAIVSHPEVLVLDEPLSYVDKRFEYKIYDIMQQLSREATIILVSHEMSVISSMANRHIVVDHDIHECSAEHHYTPQDCWPESEIDTDEYCK